MSAWIVSRAHIDAMVQLICESEIVPLSPDLVGRMLWSENVFSLAYRYPDDKDGERPGPIDFRDDDALTYTYRRPSAKLTRHDQLLALHCFNYQSSEHPDWKPGNQVHDWIATMIAKLQAAGADDKQATKEQVNGYPSPIAWGLEEENVHAVRV